jgi:SAM-dependent methyltransferase
MQISAIKLREDIYQTYHPFILHKLPQSSVDVGRNLSITLDRERADFMFGEKAVLGQQVLDIGANQGYISIEAALRGAEKIDAFESNELDSAFLSRATKLFPELGTITAYSSNFSFETVNSLRWNYVICLNVLHHVGRYFDSHVKTLQEAKNAMSRHLKSLTPKAGGGGVWLQIGFNWQGNVQQPMFKNGTKCEMAEFVVSAIGPDACLSVIGIYNPQSKVYQNVAYGDWSHPLWRRIEAIGEFPNRPLFFVECKN